MVDQVKVRMTAVEFFELPESNSPIELLDGEVIVSPTPVPNHQDTVGEFFVLLKQITKLIGGKAYVSPLEVYLDANNVPQPDVMWLSPDTRCKVGEKRLEGLPDLIIEVLSPSTAKIDKTFKLNLYEKHGVREYWIADPINCYIEVWQLIDGRYTLQGVYEPGDTFNSVILGGQTIKVSAIFGD